MKLPFSKKSKLDETLLITVPAKEIEEKVSKKLLATQKSSRIKGFRKGKAPLDVVRRLYGDGIRSDIINDSISHSFYHLVQEKGLKPVGPPKMIPKNLAEGKDIKFEATFDIYPEVNLSNLSNISFIKPSCELTADDVSEAIINLRKRLSAWKVKKGKSELGNQVKINFIGFIDGEEFEGNSAKDFTLELGSNSMIPGFEDGLLDKKKSESLSLDLSFPGDYHNKDFASKSAKFDIEVLEVLESQLPEINEEFFKSVGIEARNEDEFNKEVENKLSLDLKKILKSKIKNRLLEALLESNPFELPATMISNEVSNMRKESATRMGIDPSKIKEEDFPNEGFHDEAEKRVKLGVLLNTIIDKYELKADPNKVKHLIEERASTYKDPQEVINWFYSNEDQLKQIEFLCLEDQAADFLASKARSTNEDLTYEECIKRN